MISSLLFAIITTFLISSISAFGVFLFSINSKFLRKVIPILVALAAGVMLGASFFDLIPESFEGTGNLYFVVIGILFFFILESILHWHHIHNGDCKHKIQPVAYLNLIGDGFHNFIDGILIAAAFLVDIPTGLSVSIAVFLHEIPQEFGDFGVLLHSGFKKGKAIFYNFLSSAIAILGAILGYIFLSRFESSIPYFIAIAAGSFIYISMSDLFPILSKEANAVKKLIQILFVIIGVLIFVFLSSGHGY